MDGIEKSVFKEFKRIIYSESGIFIKDGKIGAVYSIKMSVKVPAGMTEQDLARPVVEVHDFESDKPAFELYTYGEQTVVIPVEKQAPPKINKLLEKGVRDYFLNFTDQVEVEMPATRWA